MEKTFIVSESLPEIYKMILKIEIFLLIDLFDILLFTILHNPRSDKFIINIFNLELLKSDCIRESL